MFVALIVIAVLAVAVVSGGSGSTQAPPVLAQSFSAPADPVPTNRVTGGGTASVVLQGNLATVTLTTHGLLNGSPHLAHIHGLGEGSCPTATAARLHNGHLAISTGDGIRQYGPTLVSLTEWGSTSGTVPNNIDMNRYPAAGNISYTRTIALSRLTADLIRDGNAVIVVHGIDYNANHIYDFAALGVSDLDHTFPAEATAPALCGALRPSPSSSSASAHDAPVTYTASLIPDRSPPTQAAAQHLLLYCDLRRVS